MPTAEEGGVIDYKGTWEYILTIVVVTWVFYFLFLPVSYDWKEVLRPPPFSLPSSNSLCLVKPYYAVT